MPRGSARGCKPAHTCSGHRVFQSRELKQVAHQFLEAPQLPLQPLHQHRIAAVHLGGQAVAHQQQGREWRLQFVGHIAHPPLLLVQLGLQGSAALQHHRHAAFGSGQGLEFQFVLPEGPHQPLGTLKHPRFPHQLPQRLGITELAQGLVAQQSRPRHLQQAFGAGIEQQHMVLAIDQQPAGQAGGIDPAQQLLTIRSFRRQGRPAPAAPATKPPAERCSPGCRQQRFRAQPKR